MLTLNSLCITGKPWTCCPQISACKARVWNYWLMPLSLSGGEDFEQRYQPDYQHWDPVSSSCPNFEHLFLLPVGLFSDRLWVQLFPPKPLCFSSTVVSMGWSERHGFKLWVPFLIMVASFLWLFPPVCNGVIRMQSSQGFHQWTRSGSSDSQGVGQQPHWFSLLIEDKVYHVRTVSTLSTGH